MFSTLEDIVSVGDAGISNVIGSMLATVSVGDAGISNVIVILLAFDNGLL